MNYRGKDLLRNPRHNKGSAFTAEEREQYGLRGLLPHHISTMDEQIERAMENIRRKSSDIEKYIFLSSLLDRNERLYYRLLFDHIDELMPIVYTPTVGQACQEFGHIFRQTRGFYLNISDRGEVVKLLENWHVKNVRLIVVTDGERILGLGDLGANGMGIPIGKLSLYVACAGIRPEEVLPIMLDVGTNNIDLLSDELYLGENCRRVHGTEYMDFIEEFMQAVHQVFPNALVQFEDFATPNAVSILEKYRDRCLCFNDDIQGTASVALAGLYASARATGIAFEDKRFLFLGSGSAATGIGDLVVKSLIKKGLSRAEALSRLTFINREGVVNLEQSNLQPHVKPFARDLPNLPLVDIIKHQKPNVLIGATGTPGVFTENVISTMAEINECPVIFALSNPTSRAECTAEEAYRWSDGRAVFASGSPFHAVHFKGKIRVPGQGNNAYIFPGLGLGVRIGGAKRVNDHMLIVAAEALAKCVSDEAISHSCLYPPLDEIRDVSVTIAKAVAQAAFDDCLTEQQVDDKFERELNEYLYFPDY